MNNNFCIPKGQVRFDLPHDYHTILSTEHLEIQRLDTEYSNTTTGNLCGILYMITLIAVEYANRKMLEITTHMVSLNL